MTPCRPHLLLAWLAALLGCARPTSQLDDSLARIGLENTCAAPFRAAEDLTGCEPIVPPGACAPGTMARLGEETCAPVGWTKCPAGFEADPLGWGCRDVLPSTACTGATLDALGSTSCQPIGDCTAPFPPPDATVFVDASLAQPDATHFASLAAAVAAAPGGAVIAVEAGHYAGALSLKRPVSIVGRCAERVVVQGPVSTAGLRVSAPGVQVRGVTVTGFRWGAVVLSGGALTLTESLLAANVEVGLGLQDGASARITGSVVRGTVPGTAGTLGYGVTVSGASSLTMERSAVVHNQRAGVLVGEPGARATLRGVVIRDTQAAADGADGDGLQVENGGTLSLSGCAVLANHSTGVVCLDSTLELSDSVVRDTLAGRALSTGQGVTADRSAQVTVTRSALTGNHHSGLQVLGASQLSLVDSVVRSTVSDRGQGPAALHGGEGSTLVIRSSALVDNEGQGLAVTQGASATLDRSLVAGTTHGGPADFDRGVNVTLGASLTLDRSTLEANQGAGVTVLEEAPSAQPSHLTASMSLIRGSTSAPNGERGDGLAVQFANADVVDSAIADNREAGAVVAGASSSLRLSRAVVTGSAKTPLGHYGIGVAATVDARLELVDVDVRASEGIGIAVAGASAVVVRGRVAHNPVALYLGDGSELTTAAFAPATVGPREVVVTEETRFLQNQTLVGAGTLPLPAAFSLGK